MHREEILQTIQESPGIRGIFGEQSQLDPGQYLETHFDLLLSLLQDDDQKESKHPVWMRLYQKLQFDLSHERITEIAYFILNALGPRLGDRAFAVAAMYLYEIATAADCVRQRYHIGISAEEAVASIFTELRTVDFSTDESVDLGLVQEDCVTILKEWSESSPESDLELELEFYILFLERLVTQYPMPYRFWELLLLKLDNWLQIKAGKKPRHALTDCIEALLASAPRFDFIRYLGLEVIPRFQFPDAPLGKLLLVLVGLQADSEGRLLQRFLREIDLQAWHRALPVSLAELQRLHGEAIDGARPHWERFQLDWLTEAVASLEAFLGACEQFDRLLAETGAEQERFCALMVEGLTDSGGTQRTQRLLGAIIREAVNAASLSSNILLARDLFRSRLALRIDRQKDGFFWKKYKEISLALQRFEPSSEPARAFFQRLLPLYGGLDGVAQDTLQSSYNWFDDAVPMEDVAGAGADRVLVTLRMLAVFRRTHQSRQAVLELKAWYSLVFAPFDSHSPDPQAPARLFTTVAGSLESSVKNPGCLTLLREFIRELPGVDLGQRLMREASGIAVTATSQMARQCPDFVKLVGKKGIQEAAGDNRYVLFKVAQLMVAPREEPRRQLLWWWGVAVAPYLATYHRQAYRHNLANLHQLLHEKLPDAEARIASSLVRGVYQEALGISLKTTETTERTAAGGSGQPFHALDLQGPVWERLFRSDRPMPHGVESLEQAIPDLTGQQAIRQCLEAFLGCLRRHGDEEMAWGEIQNHLKTESQVLGTAALEQQWRVMLARLPTVLGSEAAGFWTQMLAHGPMVIRQVGIGARLAPQVAALAEDWQNRLRQVLGESALEHRLQGFHLDSLLHMLVQTWQEQPPGLAVLNISRYLVEVMAARVVFSVQEWRLLWLCLEETLIAHLDTAESLGLHRWVAQLDALSDQLPAIAPLSREVFASSESVLAETRQAEQRWRQCLGALLAAAATPQDAPVTGQYLVQRLVLGSPVFDTETASSWQERQVLLSEAFPEVLSGALGRVIADRHDEIRRILDALSPLARTQRLRGIDLQYALLNATADCRVLWLQDLCFRHRTGDESIPASHDLVVAQISGWTIPDMEALAKCAAEHAAACEFREDVRVVMKRWGGLSGTPVTLSAQQQEELHLLLRFMVLRRGFGSTETHASEMRHWLFETLRLSFDDLDSDQKSAVMTSLHRNLVQHHGAQHPLVLECQRLCLEFERSNLSATLSRDYETLVKTALDSHTQILAKQVDTSHLDNIKLTIAAHLGTVFRHLGFYLGGVDCRERMGDWYWHRIGGFLPDNTGILEEQFIATMPRILGKSLGSGELALIEQPLSEIRRVFSEKRVQQG